jgi:hypothetical protein
MYVVPPDYDCTAHEMQPLDSYLLDVAVVNVIQHIFVPPHHPHNWSTWAVDNPEEASRFFSRPYCKPAIVLLGYSNYNNMDESRGGQFSSGFFLSSEETNQEGEANNCVNRIDQEDFSPDK